MSSAVDIQIVSMPNLEKIENFFKDSSYRETIEISANFNTRLCLERRLRLPFFDPQTRIAQNHSQLFLNKRQRMPGFKQGQIYTYPAPRWRKSRRQYLSKIYRFPERPFQSFRKEQDSALSSTGNAFGTGSGGAFGGGSTGGGTSSGLAGTASPTVGYNDPDLNGSLLDESSSLGAFGGDTSDSKDSQQHTQQTQQHSSMQSHSLKDEWFYDMDMNDVDSLEDPKSPIDDEYDYDPRYGSKKRKKNKKPGKKPSLMPGEVGGGPGRRKSGAGRGRNSANSSASNATTSNSLTPINTAISSDMGDNASPLGDLTTTPTSSNTGRRRGGSTRGRRRSKKGEGGPGAEPPSFESAAAAVGVVADIPLGEEHGDLRNYRKYL